MRDRLIELIDEFELDCIGNCPKRMEDTNECHKCAYSKITDYLLANGVIVPHCKSVWFIVDKGTKYAMAMPRDTDELPLYMFKDLNKYGYYETREEAEAKLKGGAE